LKIFILFFFLSSLQCTAQNKVAVTIFVEASGLKISDSIYIAGNISEIGNWNPSLIKLNKLTDSTWQRSFNIGKDEILEFKFTKGSWQTEALDDEGDILGNHIVKIKIDTTLTFKIIKWKDETHLNKENKFKGQITGQVYYHKNITGKNIIPRDIIVWVPPGYNTEDENIYPVLYAHDGQNIFDPATSSFGVDWQMDETADSLIKNYLIKPFIIVGIYNTIHRSAEYSENDTGRAYMGFVVNKLKPFIDKNYKTNPDRETTITCGSSSGGLISFMLLWEYPEIFSGAICVSPALKINKIDYVNNVQDYSGLKKPIKIYIDNGGIGIEEKLQPGIDEMVTVLLSKGYKMRKDLFVYTFENAEHNEAAWAARFWKPLKIFFGKE
jgi:predicted alpha/beta superfamily hydrolase